MGSPYRAQPFNMAPRIDYIQLLANQKSRLSSDQESVETSVTPITQTKKYNKHVPFENKTLSKIDSVEHLELKK